MTAKMFLKLQVYLAVPADAMRRIMYFSVATPDKGIASRPFGYCHLMRRLMCTDAIRWSRDIYVEHVTGVRQYAEGRAIPDGAHDVDVHFSGGER